MKYIIIIGFTDNKKILEIFKKALNPKNISFNVLEYIDLCSFDRVLKIIFISQKDTSSEYIKELIKNYSKTYPFIIESDVEKKIDVSHVLYLFPMKIEEITIHRIIDIISCKPQFERLALIENQKRELYISRYEDFAKRTEHKIFASQEHIGRLNLLKQSRNELSQIFGQIPTFFKELNIETKDFDSIFDVLSKNEIINQFAKELTCEKIRAQMIIQPSHIKFILMSLATFANDVHKKIWAHCEWIGLGRYFNKQYENHESVNVNFGAGRSFLLFTKQKEPGKIYALLKSNASAFNHIKIDSKLDKLWSFGSSKQIKLYGLIIKFDLKHKKVILDEFEPVKKIVTFSRPTSGECHKYGVLNPNAISQQDRKSKSKIEFQLSKSLIMTKVVDFGRREYLEWDGVISFIDKNTSQKRVIAYQEFRGESFNIKATQIKQWSFAQRVYAIFTFLQDLKRIICENKTFPSDIKFENLCYQNSLIHGDFYDLKFIDFLGRYPTFTPLRVMRDESKRLYQYLHPAILGWSKDNFNMHFYSLSCIKIDRKEVVDILESKIVTYQLCFELMLIIYSIFQDNERDRGAFIKFFSWTQPFVVTHWGPLMNEIGINTSARLETKHFGEIFMYFVKYEQMFDFTMTFDVIFYFFLKKLQTAFIAVVSSSPENRIQIKIDGNENSVLSNAWINKVSRAFKDVVCQKIEYHDPNEGLIESLEMI